MYVFTQHETPINIHVCLAQSWNVLKYVRKCCFSRNVLFLKEYHLEDFGEETWKSKPWSTDSKWDVSHYACSSKWNTSVWMLTLFPWDSAWNANARQRQCQSARAESWQREVGCGSCDALSSHSNRSREWQAGVSSRTWVQQREGKTLHLAMEPWREGGRKTGMKWCVCVCVLQMSFVHAWGRVCVWCSLISEVKITSRWCKNRNTHCFEWYKCTCVLSLLCY